jgi:exodeoxyribonuclease VII large subunit
MFSPLGQIRRDRQFLDGLIHRAGVGLSHSLQLKRTGLAGIEQRLKSLNPQAVLARGYAIVSTADSRLVRYVAQVGKDDELDVQVTDGTFGVRVNRLDSEAE